MRHPVHRAYPIPKRIRELIAWETGLDIGSMVEARIYRNTWPDGIAFRQKYKLLAHITKFNVLSVRVELIENHPFFGNKLTLPCYSASCGEVLPGINTEGWRNPKWSHEHGIFPPNFTF